MRKVLRAGFDRVEIFAGTERPECSSFIPFRDHGSAFRYLSQWLRDNGSMQVLRDILNREGGVPSVGCFSDPDVVKQLADFLVSGRIKVSRTFESNPVGISRPVRYPQKTKAEKPPAKPKPIERKAAPPPEPPGEFDATQAATFKEAALAGTPFCEP